MRANKFMHHKRSYKSVIREYIWSVDVSRTQHFYIFTINNKSRMVIFKFISRISFCSFPVCTHVFFLAVFFHVCCARKYRATGKKEIIANARLRHLAASLNIQWSALVLSVLIIQVNLMQKYFTRCELAVFMHELTERMLEKINLRDRLNQLYAMCSSMFRSLYIFIQKCMYIFMWHSRILNFAWYANFSIQNVYSQMAPVNDFENIVYICKELKLCVCVCGPKNYILIQKNTFECKIHVCIIF